MKPVRKSESLDIAYYTPVRRLLAMNEREQTDVLKCVTVTRALVQISPILCKTIASGPLAAHQISARSVQPFP